MNLEDLKRLRTGSPGCPSDVTLWRLTLQELSPEEAEQTRSHVDACPACPGRVAPHAAGFDVWPEPDPRRMLAAIRSRGARQERRFVERWAAQLRLALAPLVLAGSAMCLVVVIRMHGEGAQSLAGAATGRAARSEPAAPSTRAGILHVYRLTPDGRRELRPGDACNAGDRLELAVDLSSESRVQILGIGATGQLRPMWPRVDASVMLAAGKDLQVSRAVDLDEPAGVETLYLVTCPPAGAEPGCVSQGTTQVPACSRGCSLTPFSLQVAP